MTEDERGLLIDFIHECENKEDFMNGLEDMVDHEGNQYVEAISFFEAGFLANEVHYSHFALLAFEKALQLFKGMELYREVFACYVNKGDGFYNQYLHQEAIEEYQNAKNCLQTHYKPDWEDSFEYLQYSVYLNMGRPYVDSGKLKEGTAFYNKALFNAQKNDYKIGVAESCISLGNAHRNQGNLQAAKQYYQKVLTINLEETALEHWGKTYEGLGNIFFDLDRRVEAIDNYQKALKYYEKLGDRRLIAMCLVNIGNAYADRAIVHFNEKERSFEGESLAYLQASAKYYQRATKVADKEDAQVLMHLYNKMASLYEYIESIETAKKLHATVLIYAEKTKDYYFAHHTYNSLGWIYFYEGDIETALEYVQKALRLSVVYQDKRAEAIYHVHVGRVRKEKRELEEAIISYQKGIELSEQIGASLVVERDKLGYYGFQVDAYQDMLLLQLNLNKISIAFEYLERSKSKAFRDLLEKAQNKSQNTYRGNILAFERLKNKLG